MAPANLLHLEEMYEVHFFKRHAGFYKTNNNNTTKKKDKLMQT